MTLKDLLTVVLIVLLAVFSVYHGININELRRRIKTLEAETKKQAEMIKGNAIEKDYALSLCEQCRYKLDRLLKGETP